MAKEVCSRRRFLRCCGSALALAATTSQGQVRSASRASPVSLVWPDGTPVTAQSLQTEDEYLFFYPYRSTPCFLLKLGRPTARNVSLGGARVGAYRWPGGVGPEGDLVAFSAICSHKLSHPSASVSFIGYRSRAVGFLDAGNRVVRRAGVIQCCSEHSIYDPATGARVLSGPAPAPLAAVDLEASAGSLQVRGIVGEDMFERFLERFAFRLKLEYGEQRYREAVTGQTTVLRTEDYSRQRIYCS